MGYSSLRLLTNPAHTTEAKDPALVVSAGSFALEIIFDAK